VPRDPDAKWILPHDAAAYLKVSMKQISALFGNGILRGRRKGGKLHVLLADCDELLLRQQSRRAA
jgi:hypothetical protein